MERPVVLLFHPRTFHERNYRYFHIPYSLLSAAISMDRAAYEVILIDNNVVGRDDFTPELLALRGRLLCVGISSMIGHQIADGLAFARCVRAVDERVPIVWGGALPTVLPELTIRHDLIDIVVLGQGQETLPDVLAALSRKTDLSDVRGIAYKVGDHIHSTSGRPFADLNRFPSFTTVYDLVNVRDYIRFDEHINDRTVSYHSSQGCPFNCGFCSEVALWNHRWSGLSPERIVHDIERMATDFGINGVKFYDAEFFINQARALAYAQAVVDRGLNIRWAAAVHPRNADRLTDEQLALLARSGASRLLMGAESGVEQELELIGKRTNREMIVRVAARCSRFGISASFSFVTGYPDVPQGNVQATLDFASELAGIDERHEVKIHFFAPYPGTPLFARAVQNGFVPPQTLEGWSTYDYYEVTTPWIDRSWEPAIREFNEQHYPYLKSSPAEVGNAQAVKLCPLL